MKISKDARRTARQLFRLCMENGRLNEERVREVVRKLIESKPRGYVAMLEAFAGQVRAEVESQRAIVESATTLDEAMQSELRAGLTKKYNREMNLEFQVVPELLGGIRVKVGSDVWDGTVKARLESLKAQLA